MVEIVELSSDEDATDSSFVAANAKQSSELSNDSEPSFTKPKSEITDDGYTCNTCQERFFRIIDFIQHRRIHDEDDAENVNTEGSEMIAKESDDASNSKKTLRKKHGIATVSSVVIRCWLCLKRFPSDRQRKLHMKYHSKRVDLLKHHSRTKYMYSVKTNKSKTFNPTKSKKSVKNDAPGPNQSPVISDTERFGGEGSANLTATTTELPICDPIDQEIEESSNANAADMGDLSDSDINSLQHQKPIAEGTFPLDTETPEATSNLMSEDLNVESASLSSRVSEQPTSRNDKGLEEISGASESSHSSAGIDLLQICDPFGTDTSVAHNEESEVTSDVVSNDLITESTPVCSQVSEEPESSNAEELVNSDISKSCDPIGDLNKDATEISMSNEKSDATNQDSDTSKTANTNNCETSEPKVTKYCDIDAFVRELHNRGDSVTLKMVEVVDMSQFIYKEPYSPMCRYCLIRFSSNKRRTKHERIVHRKRRKPSDATSCKV